MPHTGSYFPLQNLCMTLVTPLSTFRYLICKMGLTVPALLLLNGSFKGAKSHEHAFLTVKCRVPGRGVWIAKPVGTELGRCDAATF